MNDYRYVRILGCFIGMQIWGATALLLYALGNDIVWLPLIITAAFLVASVYARR